MKRININERHIIFILAVFFKLIIEYAYSNCIGVVFDYSGIDIKFDLFKYFFSWCIALIVIFFECYVLRKDYLWTVNSLFLIFSYIPTTSLWGIKEGYSWGAICAMALYCIMMNIACCLYQRMYKENCNEVNLKPTLNKYTNKVKILILGSFFFVILFHYFFASNRFFISFADSLDVRLEMREQYIPTIFRYLYMILGCCLLPVFFTLALEYKKKIFMVFAFISSYLLYTVNGMKTWVLIYVLLIGIYFICKKSRGNYTIIKYVFIGGITLWVLGIVEYKATGGHYIIAYLHRAITLPAELHYYYYDFISKNEYVYLRESIGRFLFEQPYEQTVSRLIGFYYYGSETMNATNGMFSDAFMNFGYVGLVVYPFVILGCFQGLGKILRNTTKYTKNGITIILLIILYDNTFFTWTLTGGFLFSIISLEFIYKIVIKVSSKNYNIRT